MARLELCCNWRIFQEKSVPEILQALLKEHRVLDYEQRIYHEHLPHISVRDGLAVMNPISGTYRYPPAGPNLAEVMEFLDNRKEADELYMVVDEELKMMARICEDGGRVLGPYLKEMAHSAAPFTSPGDRDLIRDRQQRLLDEQRKRLEELQQLPGKGAPAAADASGDDERCFEIRRIELEGAGHLGESARRQDRRPGRSAPDRGRRRPCSWHRRSRSVAPE